ncbi:MAG TPA: M48 family metallopeptidase [Candidatus Nanoarchaeia archaeon]|nr:M48 family metallopeptidase [Candidatus Nanoarchaeia archaeon]
MTLYTDSDSNARKTWILMTIFFVAVIGIGWVFSQALDSPAILYIAVIFSIVSSFVSYWWSDKMVLAMSNAHEVDRDSARELYNVVENLCITAGLPVPKIYIIDDPAPNAFSTGRDKKHAVVAITTGLLNKLEKVELEGVMAHELSHIGNRDILLSTVVTVLVGVVVLLADWFLRISFWGGVGGRRRRDDNGGQIQVIILIIAIILAILAPIFAALMQLAISRKREFKADADGALLTRFPEGLIRALEKIDADPNKLQAANRATAHMYIISPLKGEDGKVGFFSKLFLTHPPTIDRINALRGLKV